MKWADLGVMRVLVFSEDHTIVNREWASWVKQHKRALSKATLPDGDMGKVIRRHNIIIDTFVAFGRKGEVKGWALISKSKFCPSAIGEVYIFVREQHRGQGIAAQLLNLLIDKHEHCRVSAWNDASWKLYSQFAARHPGKVEILDYRCKQLSMEIGK